MRPALCEDALRLDGSSPGSRTGPEVHGLVALMELRRRARPRGRPGGEPILLLDQDAAVDHLLIRRVWRRWSAPRRPAWVRPVRAPGRDRRLPCRARTPEETD